MPDTCEQSHGYRLPGLYNLLPAAFHICFNNSRYSMSGINLDVLPSCNASRAVEPECVCNMLQYYGLNVKSQRALQMIDNLYSPIIGITELNVSPQWSQLKIHAS